MARKNEAYTYLKNAIANNEFPQGAPLREVDIASKLNMSRSPVREALRDLEAEGIVVSQAGRGTFVAIITPYDVEEIYELRTMFEEYALRKAFTRITKEELDQAEANFKEPNDPFDWEKYHEADRYFHHIYIDKCGSRRLLQFLDTLSFQIERIRRYSDHSASRSSSERQAEHLEIIRYIRLGDLENSIKALRTHLRNVANSAIETSREMMTQTTVQM